MHCYCILVNSSNYHRSYYSVHTLFDLKLNKSCVYQYSTVENMACLKLTGEPTLAVFLSFEVSRLLDYIAASIPPSWRWRARYGYLSIN